MNELEMSIKHWNENLRRVELETLPDISAENCALCSVHHGCLKCPVELRTGMPHCKGSPYYKVRDLMGEKNISWQKLKAAVKVEIEFLESLR